MTILLAYDFDGVYRDESQSYELAIRNTVAAYDPGKPATDKEIIDSRKKSNNDWERTFEILNKRKIKGFERVMKESALNHLIIPKFQELYLGSSIPTKPRGYIENEPWLADNNLIKKLSKKCPLAIVSGAPKEEVEYALKKNGAFDFFSYILGMHDCNGKTDGLIKAINRFNATETYFCDDRPSGIKQGLKLKKAGMHVNLYGIRPPQENEEWDKVLLDNGAKRVFQDVNKYSKFLLDKII